MQTVFGIRPLTQEAKNWIKENVSYESWQWLGSMLCIEHRYIADIVDGMIEAGLLPDKDFAVS